MKEPQTFVINKSDTSNQYICIESQKINDFNFEKDFIYSCAFLDQIIPNVRYKLKCTLLKKVFILFLESKNLTNVDVVQNAEVTNPIHEESEDLTNVDVMLYIAKNINNEQLPEQTYQKKSDIIKEIGIRKLKKFIDLGFILQTKQLG